MKRRALTPLAEAITEAIARLEAHDALPPRLRGKLLAARTVVDQQVLLRQSQERAAKLAALEAAIRAQDERLEKRK